MTENSQNPKFVISHSCWHGRFLFIFLAGLVLICGSFPFHLDALEPGKNFALYKVDNWPLSEYGMSDFVQSIAQTRDGYLWLGTSKGLLRFDGARFVKITHATTPGEENVEIQVLFADKKGTLWGGTPTGLFKIENNQMQPVVVDNDLTGSDIGCLAADEKENLWFADYHSPYLTKLKDAKAEVFNRENRIKIRGIVAIVVDQQDVVWFGTSESGLFRLKNGEPIAFALTRIEGKYLIYSMIMDSQGDLWIGTNKGLVCVHPGGETHSIYTYSDGLSSNIVVSVQEDSKGNIYGGTMKGLNRLKRDPKTKKITGIETQLKTEVIRSIFEDRQKNLWVGTQGSGLYRFRDRPFTTYSSKNGLLSDYVGGLSIDSDGNTWIGTVAGLNLYQRDTGKIIPIGLQSSTLRLEASRAFSKDSKGNMWIGTERGIFVIPRNQYGNKASANIRQYDSSHGLIGEVIRVLCFDHNQDLWIGSLKGFSILNHQDDTIRSFPILHDGVYSDVLDIYEDRQQDIWICTNQGLLLLPGGQYDKKQRFLTGTMVQSIIQDSDGVYWVSTNGEGLFRYKNNNFFQFKLEHGLHTETIYQLIEDDLGYFWMGSKEGIIRIKREELNQVADGKKNLLHTRVFGLEDGLLTLECNRFAENTSAKSPSGELWFATHKGVSVVNPGEIEDNPHALEVIFEEIQVDGRPVPFSPKPTGIVAGAEPGAKETSTAPGKKNIYWNSKDILFRFTAPTFYKADSICFQFRLDGYQDSWLSLLPGQNTKREVVYRDLPPGKYTFHITACKSNNDWDIVESQYHFQFKDTFVHTTYFKILVLLSALLLAVVAYLKFRVKKVKNKT